MCVCGGGAFFFGGGGGGVVGYSGQKGLTAGRTEERPCRPKYKYTLHKLSIDPSYSTIQLLGRVETE